MSGPQFTPGAWRVGPPHVVRIETRDEQGRRVTGWIAECCNQIGRPIEETKANAHLIAAAPDMFAALEWALSNKFDSRDQNAIFSAALAKARGE